MRRESFCPSFLQELVSRGRSSLASWASGGLNMSANTQTGKGPLWSTYRFSLGRKLKRDDKSGVVLGELAGNLKVLWLDDSTEFDIEEKPIAELEAFLLDEFDDEFAFNDVVEARKRGWTKEAQRKKRKSRAEESDKEGADPPKAAGDDDDDDNVDIDDEEKETEQGSPDEGVYIAPNGGAMNIPDTGMPGLTKIVYPKEVCYTPGDRLLEAWSMDEGVTGDDDMDFEVERIVDERVAKGKKEYLVKWKGFQLNPGSRKRGAPGIVKRGDWLPAENLEDAFALDVWEAKKPQYYLDAQAAITPARVTPPRAKKRRHSLA